MPDDDYRVIQSEYTPIEESSTGKFEARKNGVEGPRKEEPRLQKSQPDGIFGRIASYLKGPLHLKVCAELTVLFVFASLA